MSSIIRAPRIYQHALRVQSGVVDVFANRRANLLLLLDECEPRSYIELARRLKTADNYLSQILGKGGSRAVGTKLARRAEDAFGKPPGWMDAEHARTWADEVTALHRRIQAMPPGARAALLQLLELPSKLPPTENHIDKKFRHPRRS